MHGLTGDRDEGRAQPLPGKQSVLDRHHLLHRQISRLAQHLHRGGHRPQPDQFQGLIEQAA